MGKLAIWLATASSWKQIPHHYIKAIVNSNYWQHCKPRNKTGCIEKMAAKVGGNVPQVGQQIEISKLSLPQLTQLKQQLDQVFIYS